MTCQVLKWNWIIFYVPSKARAPSQTSLFPSFKTPQRQKSFFIHNQSKAWTTLLDTGGSQANLKSLTTNFDIGSKSFKYMAVWQSDTSSIFVKSLFTSLFRSFLNVLLMTTSTGWRRSLCWDADKNEYYGLFLPVGSVGNPISALRSYIISMAPAAHLLSQTGF